MPEKMPPLDPIEPSHEQTATIYVLPTGWLPPGAGVELVEPYVTQNHPSARQQLPAVVHISQDAPK